MAGTGRVLFFTGAEAPKLWQFVRRPEGLLHPVAIGAIERRALPSGFTAFLCVFAVGYRVIMGAAEQAFENLNGDH
jgi:hypothetical protein